MGKFVESNFHHYEFLGDHFAQVKGYDAYAQKAAIAKKGGLDGATDGFMQATWGHRSHPCELSKRDVRSWATSTERGVSVWRRALGDCRARAATLRRGGAAGLEDLDGCGGCGRRIVSCVREDMMKVGIFAPLRSPVATPVIADLGQGAEAAACHPSGSMSMWLFPNMAISGCSREMLNDSGLWENPT
jgi:hypothetical protein